MEVLLRLFLQEKKIVQSKFDSADRFIHEVLPKFLMKEVSPIIVYEKSRVVWFVIEFLSINIQQPTFREKDDSVHLLYPNECLLRNLTYQCDVRATTRTRLYAAGESFRLLSREDRDLAANSETLEGIQRRGILQSMQMHKDVLVVQVPAMIRSSLCNTGNLEARTLRNIIKESLLEDGSQFIIDGVERALKYSERLLAYDTPLYTPAKKESSYSHYSHMVENRSGHPHISRSSSTLRIHVTSARNKNRSLYVQFNQNTEAKTEFVPVCHLLKSLALTEEDIRVLSETACPQVQWLWTSMHESIMSNNLDISKHLTTQDKALVAMGQCMNKSTTKPLHFARRHISKELLPHISYKESEFRRKAFEVCLESMELCDRLFIDDFQERIRKRDPDKVGDGFDPWDNKDKYSNKGIETPCDLLSGFFRPSFKGAIINLKRQIRHLLKTDKPINIATIWKPATSARPLLSAIANGLWNVSKTSNSKTGFTERYDHQNPFAALTQQYRVNSGAPKEGGKSQSMRLIWGSFGIICPLASTEGPTCGLIKELNPLVIVSLGVDPHFIRQLILEQKNVNPFERFSTPLLQKYHQDKRKTFSSGDEKEMLNFPHLIPISVNGDPFAFCSKKHPLKFVAKIKEWRRKNIISKHTSVSVRYISPFFLSPLFWEHKVAAPSDAVARRLLQSNKNFQIKSIDIRTGGTRPLRPLIVVDKLPLLDSLNLKQCSWSELLTRGILDYVDQREEECSFVAVRREVIEPGIHEFLELHDITSIGLAASGLPFLDHNPPSKTTHQSQRLKQVKAAGMGLDYYRRCDTNMFLLNFPERPCVQTAWLRYLGIHRVGMGYNVIVAVKCSTGEDQEDAPIFARQPVELGLFRNRVTRTSCVIESRAPPKDPKKEWVREQCEMLDFKCSGKKLRVTWSKTPWIPLPSGKHDKVEAFGPFREEECVNPSNADFLGIESDGFHGTGYFVTSSNVVAQKSSRINSQVAPEYKNLKLQKVPLRVYNSSVCQKGSDHGHIEQTFLTHDSNTDRMAKLKVSKAGPPIPGDKFSSRHGQKGVEAIVKNQEDMPYDPVTGIVPHLLVDVIGFYGRVTKGQFFEGTVSSICDLAGIRQADGTPWTDQMLEEIRQGVLAMGVAIDAKELSLKEALGKFLHAMGLPPTGCRRLVDGVTGKYIDASVFMNPCYYTALKQQVADKMRARSTGKMDPSLCQPVGTKKNGGGIKVGEMELNCLKWHGASANLEGRTFRSSDSGSNTHICSNCNDFIFATHQEGQKSDITYCMPCRQLATGTQNQLPLGLKSWVEDIRTTGCNISFYSKLVNKTGC